MDITFGAINLKDRDNGSPVSTYFANVFSTLSLSRPTVFLKEAVGIATAREVHDGLYRSAEFFRDPDTKILVAINGDLVNRGDLEKELRNEQSPGPTAAWGLPELVYRMYRSYGIGFVSKLNGVANVAIWHETEGKLLLIPDPFGFRPFYYFDDGSTFVFASSIKAILQHPIVPRAVKPDALYELLALGFILPPNTLFKGLKIVSAGDYLELIDAPVVRPLPTKIPSQISEYDEDRAAEQYFGLLKNAVSRMVGDTKRVSVLLSGGVDSSALVGLLRDIGSREIVTYSMHLAPDPEELQTARDVSRMFATEHRELTELGPESLNDLPEVVWQLEVPRVEVLAEYALCRFVNSDGSPVLTGDGNDIPWGLLSPAFLETSGKSIVELYLLLRRRMTDEILKTLLRESGNADILLADRIAGFSPNTGNVFRDLISLDRRLFGAHFVNRMLGKLRIENGLLGFRFPYLDKHIIEFVASLPDSAKARRSDAGRVIFKYLFKRALEKHRLLPERIIHRKKTWMYHPTGSWLRDRWGKQLERLISKTKNDALQYFDTECIKELWREHRQGKSDCTHGLETILLYLVWHKIFIESKKCERPGVPFADILT